MKKNKGIGMVSLAAAIGVSAVLSMSCTDTEQAFVDKKEGTSPDTLQGETTTMVSSATFDEAMEREDTTTGEVTVTSTQEQTTTAQSSTIAETSASTAQSSTTMKEVATTTQPPTTTTQATTTAVKETESSKKYIGHERRLTEAVIEPYKYGLVLSTQYEYNYYLYSDGTSTRGPEPVRVISTVDTTNYNATDEQLMEEARVLVESNRAEAEEVLRLVNEIRAEAGVPALVLDEKLCVMAAVRALEMDYTDSFSHWRPGDRDWYTIFDLYPEESYSATGENIGVSTAKAEHIVEAWKNSASHYENMISTKYTKLGIGHSNVCPAGKGNYWSQLFSN